MTNINIGRLEAAKDKLAMVYEKEARDEVYDNGNLSSINQAILEVEDALRVLKKREKEAE